jgi:hypothetical protein
MKGGEEGKTTWWRSERIRGKKACLRSDVRDFRPSNSSSNSNKLPLLLTFPLLISRYSLFLYFTFFSLIFVDS